MVNISQIRLKKVPRAEVVILNLHLSPFVAECMSGIQYLSVDLKEPIVYLDVKFLMTLLRCRKSVSRLAAWVTAVAYASGSRVVMTMDNFDTNNHHVGEPSLLEEISTVSNGTSLLSIQHGQELRRNTQSRRSKNVTLLCWGEWVRDNYPKFGRTEAQFVSVGALVNDLYVRLRPVTRKENTLLVISTVKDETWWGDGGGNRQSSYAQLINFVHLYCVSRKLRPVVALTTDRDHNPMVDESRLEREWFNQRLYGNVEFSEPRSLFGFGGSLGAPGREPRYAKERYATYFLCDCSNVTIGMSSTVLWESFARGNKILSVNLSDDDVYNFPIDGPWSMERPTFAEFAERLEWISNLSDEEWESMSIVAREYLVRDSSKESVADRVNREVRIRLDTQS